ncbi:receptor-like protein EIX2 [Cocos nucifera]|uniref:Receptor-like protein EIX2 n=1 Tax=Cocos nucifera TaxID=13894 RepID=A0A8K0IGG9_COCNU|nr:receptor-like protein EIX2 [Cocos nucifera]
MASTKTSIPLAYVIWIGFLLFFGSVQLCLCFSGNSSRSGSCIERERNALLSIQKSIYDAHKWLSWNGNDCCRWRGVGCNAITGHVVKLDLRHPYPYYVANFDENLNKSEVSPSVLHLRHLKYLDLSMNYFGGSPIPDFIGSLANLEYLNLSSAGFGGTIPHQLGNLSNLLYLDLNSYNDFDILDVDNLAWLAQIRSLRYLDMSYVRLSKASNWIHMINMLPSLSVLYLSHAALSSLPFTLPHVNFTSLTTLDLSMNNFASIPSWMFNLSSLEYLNLGTNNFYGNIPLTIGNLRKLQVLNLSRNSFSGDIPKIVWSLKSLRSIDLSENKISGVMQETMGNLKSLEFLDLRSNCISGVIPKTMGNLKSLEFLDLSRNSISGEIPKTITSLTKLWYLWLGDNNISGQIPGTLGNLVELHSLYLSNNVINEQIPETVGNLHHLEGLYLENNSLAGVIPRTMGNLCNLRYFSASENNIGGEITGFMKGFSRCSAKRLQSIDLHNNNLSGPLPSQIGELQSLEYLYLGFNSLNGSIPPSLGKLSALSRLDLSSNSWSGALTEAHFANLKSLLILDISHSSLTINVSQDWLPPFKAVVINMRSCPLGPKFPSWLRNQTDLYALDLSSAGISENFPDWFWDMDLPFSFLNVSNNCMKGKLPISIKKKDADRMIGTFIDWSLTSYLLPEGGIGYMPAFMDLSSNLFSGPIPPTLADKFGALLLAHNKISGSIPSAFCEANYLQVLNLADNNLLGVLPDCWNNSLTVIDFSDNKLSGGIPSSMGSLSQLRSLHLGNNNLSGKIPRSLQQCKQLITLDLGNNKVSGSIPEWIGESLSSLQVLRLRSNMLDGNIPTQLSLLASLQVLDLAGNKLSGTLPPSFGDLIAMIVTPNGSKPILSGLVATYYTENLLITMKNLQLTFTTVLSLVTSLDLSDNNISGEIPKEYTNLRGLYYLNLSRNHLTGRIPKNIGSMGQLESLDLSMNNLSSTIPTSIANLDSLGYLNLSHNNLSGRFPFGNHLQTLINDPSTYIGNRYLCGLPLLEKCPDDEPAVGPTAHGREEKQDENENDSEMIWFYVGLSPGFVVGFWGFLGAVMLKKSTRYAYIRFIDRLCDWIYMATTINSAKPKSKRNRGRM